MAGFAASGRGSVCTWQSACMYFRITMPSPCRYRPTAVFPLARRSDRKRTWSRRKPVETLAEEVAVVSYGLGILSRSLPCRNRRGRRSRRRRGRREVGRGGGGGEEEEEEKGLARGEKNTGVLLSTAGNSAQPPPTGTSDESIDLGVGLKTPLSPAPPASARSPVAAPPPPCSSSALLSRFTSSLLLPFTITDIVLLTRFPLSFFFSPKVDQTGGGRASIVPYRRSSYSWEALTLDDDIHAIYDFPVILKIPSYSSAMCEYFLSAILVGRRKWYLCRINSSVCQRQQSA